MAKPKMKKFPNKPKKKASVSAKQTYIKRIAEIRAEYKTKMTTYNSDLKKSKTLSEQIKKVKR